MEGGRSSRAFRLKKAKVGMKEAKQSVTVHIVESERYVPGLINLSGPHRRSRISSAAMLFKKPLLAGGGTCDQVADDNDIT